VKFRQVEGGTELTLDLPESVVVNAMLAVTKGEVPAFNEWSDYDDLVKELVGADAMEAAHALVHSRVISNDQPIGPDSDAIAAAAGF
jgi:hypothetical protein